MARSKWFLLFVNSFLAGIIAGKFLLEGDFLKIFVVFGVLVLGVMWMWLGRVAACLVVVALLFGVFRFFISFEYGNKHIQNYEEYIQFEGCVVDEVDVRNDRVKYTVETQKVLVEGEWLSVEGRVLVTGRRYPVYEYGDCFLVSGKIEKPGAIEDFQYDKYLARYSIYAVVYRANISKIPETDGSVFFRWIYDLKGIFESKLARIFAEPHGSFMAGLIWGSRRGIPEHLMADFNTTGLTHIIAISGYNVTLVIVVVSGLFGFLSRKTKVVASAIFVVLFVILVGASASVVRAAIMGVISLIALWFGRQYYVIIALFAAAFFMNLWNPKILVYDVGFQLSFLATLGIILFSSRIERYFRWVPAIFGMREAVLMTLSAQILALPVIILCFGRLSMISPIANVFVLPLIPLAMIFGFLATVISFISAFLGNLIGFLGYLILEFIIFFVKIFASFSFASLEVRWAGWWMVIVWWIAVLKFTFYKRRFC